jgi:PIN domain nuclease of toxin-antitoxin system
VGGEPFSCFSLDTSPPAGTDYTSRLPPHHRDPFDRLLICQSEMEGLSLLTADPIFWKYEAQLIPAGR